MTIVRFMLGLLILAAAGIAQLPQPAQAQYRPPSLEYGASVWVLGKPETIDRDLDMLKAAGLTWAKMTVPWRSIETSCNDCYQWGELDTVVNAAIARGIKLLVRVDHPPTWARAVPAENGAPDNPEDYADIISAIVARYGSANIPVIQIWNEPNLDREWGSPITRDSATQYVHMLRRAYEEAKKKDPYVTILSAGLSPTGTADGSAQPDDVYLQWMYEDGLAKWTDAIGMHGNSYGLPPEAALLSDPVQRPHASFYFRRLEQLRGIMVANGDEAKAAWIVEFGYTSDQVNPAYSWFAIDETTKADYIVRALQYARTNYPWVAVMTVWTFADPEWTPANEQFWWSITEPDGTPRPAYGAIQQARTTGALP